ncbi:heavy metal translocating P-type ATPase [Halalkalibacillus halophilus]|uniref:heavy metal translocating P-type ATPase n=1 Tax=Halalkalibacillus halophilus TaxID=392827 RepID=UPI000428094A|nr:heavy metal translocating P-type ATPase [Halalkalibacillus halophilus]
MPERDTYYVQGMTCANCAKTFENNLKSIDTVNDAEVNYGASKVTIYGQVSTEEMEKAGSFENLRITKEYTNSKRSLTNQLRSNFHILISISLVLIGIYFYLEFGEYHPATVAIFVTSMVIGGYSLFIAGFQNLIKLRFDMKTLMTIAVIGAALIGEWIEGAVVVILFAISEALERYSMDQARSSIQSLMDQTPPTAIRLTNGEQQTVNVSDLKVGDFVAVKPGAKVPADGKIRKGSSTFNQSMITGESMPVDKKVDQEVFAGALNGAGYVEVEVTKRSEDSTMAKIIHLVEEAQNEKAPAQHFVDQFAKYYTPLIILIAIGVATLPPMLFGLSYEAWVYQGLAVLVVGCPCALVISTPIAIVTAIGTAAKNGVLIKGGAFLEVLGQIKVFAFDKTGTITHGNPEISDYYIFDEEFSEEEFFTTAAALEKHSEHPLAKAIMNYTQANFRQDASIEVSNFQSHTGKGIEGEIRGTSYQIGSPASFSNLEPEVSEHIRNWETKGNTIIVLRKNGQTTGIIAIADMIREQAKAMIESLKELNIHETILLTGDHEPTAKAIQSASGIKHSRSQLLPEEKHQEVERLKKSFGKVAMVGDGVNDAPALAASDLGIAMGSAGADTALETADLALMGDDLWKLPYAVRLSRRTLTIIKQNISFALGLKALALLLVIPGWLTLWIAILADMGATLLVTLNALRLFKN